MVNRRTFIKTAAGAAAFLGLRRRASAYSAGPGLKLWQTTLRGAGPGGIPVAAPDSFVAPTTQALHYTVNIRQFADQLHPDLGATTLWGYDPAIALGTTSWKPTHLGGIVVARKGVPIQMTFRNRLPSTPLLPVDTTLPGAADGPSRTAVHLHGGFVPWVSDGGPMAWFAPDGRKGMSFVNVLNPNAAPNEAEYYYPNQQSARMLWYHDHAMGITRLNAYAGIATAYIIRDDFEGSLRNAGLPDYIENGGRELPIVIQEKIFVDRNTIRMLDPTWPGLKETGELWYPHVYEADLWNDSTAPDPSCVPEFFGDTMLANGTVYPQANVEARRYRLRILNATQARFMNLQLYVDDGSASGITLNSVGNPRNGPGPGFLQIGTEGGFLPRPVMVPSNVPFNPQTLGGSLILAPAERADVIVDFSGFAGRKVILYTDAPAPFPMGDEDNDFKPSSAAGLNTREILRFNIGPATSADPPLRITTKTDLTPGNDPLPVRLGDTKIPFGLNVRQLTLNEDFDSYGRLIQRLGTNQLNGNSYARNYTDAPTETPLAGSMEVWQIANLTGDTHPMHFHLANVQIISRQPFNEDASAGTPLYTGPARPPQANECGWKETVRMNPGEVTTVLIPFNLPKVPFTVPSSPMWGGNEYVWHCHILEHEEHDMMRPLIVS
jgi:spore coat protein A